MVVLVRHMKSMLKDELFRTIVGVIFTKVLLKGVNFFSIFILLQFLTPHEMGRYGLFISTIVLSATFGNFGLRNAIALNLGKGENLDLVKSSIVRLFPIISIISIVTLLLVYLVNGVNSDNKLFYMLSIISVMAYLFLTINQGICLGKGKIRIFNIIDLLPKVFLLIFIVGTAYVSHSLNENTAIWGAMIGYVISVMYVIRFTCNNIDHSVKVSNNYLFLTLRQGFPFCLALTLIMLNSHLPIYLSNLFYGEDTTGEVFTVIKINNIFLELSTAVSLVLFSHSVRSNEEKDFSKIYVTMTIVVLVATLISLFVYIYSDLLISFVANVSEYPNSGKYLSLIVVALPFVSFNKMSYGYLSGKGKPYFGVITYVVAIIVNLFVSYFLEVKGVEESYLYGLVSSQVLASGIFMFFMLIERKYES